MFGIRLGVEEWRRLERELARIAGQEELELVLNVTLVDPQHQDEGEHHVHEHLHEETEFTKAVSELVEEVSREMGLMAHHHLHGHHGTVSFAARGSPGQLLSHVRQVLARARECEPCAVHTVDGELHLGEDLAALYFGDAYKLTFIVPAEDGRRLRVFEIHT